MAIGHVIGHEHLLLHERARSAAAHIRKPAGGLCVCGGTLYLAPEADVPARYCSAQCASSAATSTVAQGHRIPPRDRGRRRPCGGLPHRGAHPHRHRPALSTGRDDAFPIETMQLMRFKGERWQLFGKPVDTRKEFGPLAK
ncbi:hypothetical protein AB0N07_39365 [Streptomyces sp. NPDC051172]|uniref:hypothetical protein n=1 Tax=Streptomyces sp. NPDC051172 TaxID=3155796 RepID=UPI0034409D6E